MDLKTLIGKPLHEMTDEELDAAILTGRLAREEDAAERKVKASGKKKEPTPARVAEVSIDLDDMPDF